LFASRRDLKININSGEIRHFYEKEGLSIKQIAEQYGVVKSVILRRLRQMGVDTQQGHLRTMNPNNYRKAKAPYGYKIKNGKLILNKSEVKACRVVAEMMGRQNKSARETARELMKRGFKNRQGDISWGHLVVQKIFKR
jgi:IS30 family transposase